MSASIQLSLIISCYHVFHVTLSGKRSDQLISPSGKKTLLGLGGYKGLCACMRMRLAKPGTLCTDAETVIENSRTGARYKNADVGRQRVETRRPFATEAVASGLDRMVEYEMLASRRLPIS